MNQKMWTKTIIGIVVIGGALGYFVYAAMQSSWAYYISVDELNGPASAAQAQLLRVAGTVGAGSIERDLKAMKLDFDLVGQTASLPVTFTGVVPENFAEGREVVVEGRLTPAGAFVAEKVLTKCESKYEAKLKESGTR